MSNNPTIRVRIPLPKAHTPGVALIIGRSITDRIQRFLEWADGSTSGLTSNDARRAYDAFADHSNEAKRVLEREGRMCPICGAINLVWCDYERWYELQFGTIPDSCQARGYSVKFQGFDITVGSGCWDSAFGDECGSCLQTVCNVETMAVPVGGMGH